MNALILSLSPSIILYKDKKINLKKTNGSHGSR